MPMPTFPPSVPILGRSFKVLAAYSTAIIECQCEDKPVIVLQCKGKTATCPACGKTYGIADSGPLKIGEAVTTQEAIDRMGQ